MINSKIITLYMPQENLLWVHWTHILLAQCPRLTLLFPFHRDLYFSWRSRTRQGTWALFPGGIISDSLFFPFVSMKHCISKENPSSSLSSCWKLGEHDVLVGDHLLWSDRTVRLFMKALKCRCKNLEAALEWAQKTLEVNCLSKWAKSLRSLQEILMGS